MLFINYEVFCFILYLISWFYFKLFVSSCLLKNKGLRRYFKVFKNNLYNGS